MVTGIDKFKEYFAQYEDNYIIIGGTACDMIEENAGQIPRATKDIDIILIVEALSPEFVKRFWEFVRAGDYSTRQRGNGENEYFRFLKPQTKGFPFQVELFARKPDVLQIAEDTVLTPIPVNEDLSSLSAILMNEEYYNFTMEHSHTLETIRLANTESLVCLKAKAYLDLTQRKANGEVIDEKNIRKHRSDIFRLTTTLGEDTLFELPAGIQTDLNLFGKMVSSSIPDKAFFKSVGLLNIKPEEVFERLCSVFHIDL